MIVRLFINIHKIVKKPLVTNERNIIILQIFLFAGKYRWIILPCSSDLNSEFFMLILQNEKS